MQSRGRGRKRKALEDVTNIVGSPTSSSSSSSSSATLTHPPPKFETDATDNDAAIAATLGDNDFYYDFGSGESKDDPDYTDNEPYNAPPSNSASSSSSSSSSSCGRAL